MGNRETALAFVDAINRHDVEAIAALMAPEHRFVDAYGHTEDRQAMLGGWPGYFAWFPDYLIEVEDVFEQEDQVVLLGFAGGTYSGKDTDNRWRLPAAWRVRASGGQVTLWQVYCDSKIPYNIMGVY